MSLTPEEMSWAEKLREDTNKFSRVILLPDEAKELADELERLQEIAVRRDETVAMCIQLGSELVTYKEALEVAEIELLRARNTLEAFEYQLAQTKLVEGIYAALTRVRKVLGKV